MAGALLSPGTLQPRYLPGSIPLLPGFMKSARRGKECRAVKQPRPPPRIPPPDPNESEESRDAKTRKWLWDRGWAPWEEIHPPENEFALKSLGNMNKNPVLPREMEKLLFETPPPPPEVHIEGDHSFREQTHIFRFIPPRDWPPPGWKVDPQELEFIRETHTMYDDDLVQRVTPEDLENAKPGDDPGLCFDRWNTFRKQYDEWADANRDRLDKEALEADPHYEPGRRRTGEEKWDDNMLELPFIYPGQYYQGVVSHVDLYDGAFIYIGAVHDGWVSIEDNDWFKLRHIIQAGDEVVVEILAKRDPYRYRFPIECRFVDPNIDSLIFRRQSKYPPITSRPGDRNLVELARETGRPYLQNLTPDYVPETDPRNCCHPYIFKVWQLQYSEQLLLDEEDAQEFGEEVLVQGPSFKVTRRQWDEYMSQGIEKKEVSSSSDEDSDDDAEKKQQPTGLVRIIPPTDAIPHVTYDIRTDISELDMDTARAEKKHFLELKAAAEARGEEFVCPMTWREVHMATLECMHKRRCWEENQTLLRDITCRLEAGLPIEDERYSDDPWPDNIYNPKKKIWQAPYKPDGDSKPRKYAKFKREALRAKRSTLRRKATTKVTDEAGN